MKFSYVMPCAVGLALAVSFGPVELAAQQPTGQQQERVQVRKDARVVREDPGAVAPQPQVARVSVTSDRQEIEVGQNAQLRTEVFDAQDQQIYDRQVICRSENPEVATVDQQGRITTVGPGTATIVAEVDGQQQRTTITVTEAAPRVSRINVTADRQTLRVGEDVQLNAEVFGADDQVMTDRQVTWRSENPEIATVSADGRVTAMSPGTATIVAETDGQQQRTMITVEERQDLMLAPRGAFYWGIGGGLNFPTGTASDTYDTGYNITLPFGWDPIGNPWGARVTLAWEQLGGRSFAAGQTQVSTRNAQALSAMLSGTLRLPMMEGEGRTGPYVMAGVGLHHLRNFTAVAENPDPDAPQFEFETENTTRFGWNAGAGFAFGVGGASLFLEGRYVSVATPGRNLNYLPVTLGITF